MSIGRLSILGLGLIGGSIARAVRQQIPDCQITAYDNQPVDANAVHVLAASPEQACNNAELIILCVPPGAVRSTLSLIRSAVPGDAIVSDVTSVKRSVLQAASETLQFPARFVGVHPMAGSERSGMACARADLFADASVVLTPDDRTDSRALVEVETFWQRLGGVTVRMSAEEHDRRVALISHLPHLLASALIHLTDADARSIAGNGFRDMTRIAAGDAALWRQILSENHDQVKTSLGDLIAQLQSLDSLLNSNRRDELQNWLDNASRLRKSI
ncbi:MAG: prephenate dehydrogenase/arogenate dehydrogenase family protein [Phycisphaerae bacterium]|nr:prephenate dehydrogenase/arogenate dehydrogenase family protein [Phycisphaerae bacterium]